MSKKNEREIERMLEKIERERAFINELRDNGLILDEGRGYVQIDFENFLKYRGIDFAAKIRTAMYGTKEEKEAFESAENHN